MLATLRAGSLTEDGRALLRSGRLTEELEPPGFEALAGLDMPAAPSRPPKRAPAAETRRRVRDLTRELRALEAQAAAAERRAEQLREELRDAEAEASRLDEERRGVEEELAAAEDDLEEAT